MNRYEIASYAELLPDGQRDLFAKFALRFPVDRVRGFIRYQLQMRKRGFKPLPAPPVW